MASSVRLRVKVGGALAADLGRSEVGLVVAETLTLREVAHAVGVSPGLVMLYIVNGTVQSPEFVPRDGDEVLLIPAVSGG
ncbi:MAG: MoaD/ThiS family protein [Chloroflexota bacterium]